MSENNFICQNCWHYHETYLFCKFLGRDIEPEGMKFRRDCCWYEQRKKNAEKDK